MYLKIKQSSQKITCERASYLTELMAGDLELY